MRHGSLAIGGQDAGPLVVAHRGAWGLAPQNSLAAFEEAVQLGCDAIELDVRRTLDGRVVVVHDARSGVRPIAKLTHEELQVDFLAPHARLARAGLLGWATARELPCWVWTVNDRRALRLLGRDPRVAAVITDRPDRALKERSTASIAA